jgi:hypothetical protein
MVWNEDIHSLIYFDLVHFLFLHCRSTQYIFRFICPEIVDVREGEGNSTDGEKESQRATKEEMNPVMDQQQKLERTKRRGHHQEEKKNI